MEKAREKEIFKTFIISLAITLLACLAATFVIVSITNNRLIEEQARTQGRTHFKSIVMTRKWNARHGGVYVKKAPGVQSNPYLDNPDITAIDGTVYTKKNPALMTREISEYSEKEGLFSFHMTSLKPLNPINAPDEFERDALKNFEKGTKEAYESFEKKSRAYFRYMGPLFVEEECLQCHAKHGYKLGDIRGGISITFSLQDVKNIQRKNTIVIIMLAIISTSIILGLTGLFTIRLMRQVSQARRKIEKMAITDELTGLFNRRHIIARFEEEFERAKRLSTSVCCIMLDLDNFKQINDTYGHLIGDDVLRETARLLQESIRTYDVIGRYGGEEFLIIFPDTGPEETRLFAERIRAVIKESKAIKSLLTHGNAVSVSLGTTCIRESDRHIDELLKRADDCLYQAKVSGKDRVKCS
ncbi:MAG: diguanylate cyclase [Nitrospiraceae bacterium]|nr:MAG: diguanylate cyclase [Nitrospiraceae bacterium]